MHFLMSEALVFTFSPTVSLSFSIFIIFLTLSHFSFPIHCILPPTPPTPMLTASLQKKINYPLFHFYILKYFQSLSWVQISMFWNRCLSWMLSTRWPQISSELFIWKKFRNLEISMTNRWKVWNKLISFYCYLRL